MTKEEAKRYEREAEFGLRPESDRVKCERELDDLGEEMAIETAACFGGEEDEWAAWDKLIGEAWAD